MRLEIGNRVRCTDGVYGELADIVIDPLEKRVAHLVVRPEHGEGEARLVPIQLAKSRDGEQREIELQCTLDEAQGFESVREAAFLRLGESPAEDPDWDVGVEDVLAMPYYAGLDVGSYSASSTQRDHLLRPRAEGRGRGPAASAVISADDHSLARWTASWSTRTSTSRTSSSSAVTFGAEGGHHPDRGRRRERRGVPRYVQGRGRRAPPFGSADTADALEPPERT
jgi:hypothetical protein